MNDSTNIKKRLLSYTRPYWGRLTVGIILAVVVSAATGAAAWIVKPVLDDVFLRKDTTILKILPILFVSIYVIKGAARYGQSYLMRSVGQKIIMKIRNDLYGHIQKMPLSFFHNTPSAVLMSRITNDVTMLGHVSSQVVADFFRQTFTFLILMGIIFYREWRLAALSLIVFPFIAVLIVKIGRKLRELSMKNQEKMATMKEAKRYEMLSPLMELFGAVGAGVVIWYGGHRVISGATTPGTFFSFMTALIMLYEPIKKMSTMNSVVQQAMAAAERVFNILNINVDTIGKDGTRELKEFRDRIIFYDVWFQYNDNEMVLKGINLEVKKGEVIAVVGSSGAGKSTLVDMIPRFYDVTKGSIKIDNHDIRDLTLNSLRRQIGIVTQETILFNDTVKNNISYGRVDASRDDIYNAAQSAYAHNFIMAMPAGYDTVIGERGVKLSGGQRQRLSIARAILKNPAILILDEATSSLDTESEKIVQEALENLMKDRTTVVIAHRLSTILDADRIIVLNDGRIVETGRHDELLASGGVYRRLYEMQFKE
ncbi:MAG: ATP-binding cassette domain-containing protein [Nitrospinae bacterium]|nr:ATP-binding cassette domain-containing protein [Nitrospinota bacterium]